PSCPHLRTQAEFDPADLSACEHPLLVDMEVIVRRQDHPRYASITCMIRHYVARRAQVIEDHPHNAAMRYVGTNEHPPAVFGFKEPGASLQWRAMPPRTLTWVRTTGGSDRRAWSAGRW